MPDYASQKARQRTCFSAVYNAAQVVPRRDRIRRHAPVENYWTIPLRAVYSFVEVHAILELEPFCVQPHMSAALRNKHAWRSALAWAAHRLTMIAKEMWGLTGSRFRYKARTSGLPQGITIFAASGPRHVHEVGLRAVHAQASVNPAGDVWQLARQSFDDVAPCSCRPLVILSAASMSAAPHCNMASKTAVAIASLRRPICC